MIILFIRVCFCSSFLKQYFYSFLKARRWLTGMGALNRAQDGAIIQLFTDVENLPSLVFFLLISKHTKSCSLLPLNTDWHVHWIKPQYKKKEGELSWSGAMLFIWLFRIWENKHRNGTLIKDTTVAFHFHCPRTYSSADYIVTWQLWTRLYINIWYHNCCLISCEATVQQEDHVHHFHIDGKK